MEIILEIIISFIIFYISLGLILSIIVIGNDLIDKNPSVRRQAWLGLLFSTFIWTWGLYVVIRDERRKNIKRKHEKRIK